MSKQREDFTSTQTLQWLQQYKKLSARDVGTLSESEKRQLTDLERKLALVLESKMPAAIQNQRQTLRVKTELEISIGTAEELQKLYIKNVSGGGMYVATQSPYPLGTRVAMQVKLPGYSQVQKIEGVVAWINTKTIGELPPGIGIRFVNLSVTQHQMIQKLIHSALDTALKQKKKTDK